MENTLKKQVFIIPSLFDNFTWSRYIPPKEFNWEKTENRSTCDVELGIDNCFFDFKNKSKKILYLVEPIGIYPQIYSIFNDLDLLQNIDLIGTHHKRFATQKNIIHTTCPIPPQVHEKFVFQKTKLCSIVTSLKNFAPGHAIRINILKNINEDTFDKYGAEFNPIEKKDIGLKDYCFSFAIENCNESGYYTEKILDCFLTGTIPIYWGDPDINKIFDSNGIINLDDNFDYKNLSFDLYKSKLNSVYKNFEIASSLIKTNNIDYCLNMVVNHV